MSSSPQVKRKIINDSKDIDKRSKIIENVKSVDLQPKDEIEKQVHLKLKEIYLKKLKKHYIKVDRTVLIEKTHEYGREKILNTSKCFQDLIEEYSYLVHLKNVSNS